MAEAARPFPADDPQHGGDEPVPTGGRSLKQAVITALILVGLIAVAYAVGHRGFLRSRVRSRDAGLVRVPGRAPSRGPLTEHAFRAGVRSGDVDHRLPGTPGPLLDRSRGCDVRRFRARPSSG